MSKVYYYGALREMTGKREEVLNIGDVKSCLNEVKRIYGTETYKEAKRSLITCNGISILFMDNFKTIVNEKDELRFLPICGGG